MGMHMNQITQYQEMKKLYLGKNRKQSIQVEDPELFSCNNKERISANVPRIVLRELGAFFSREKRQNTAGANS